MVIAAHLPGDDAARLAGSGATTVPLDLRSPSSIRRALGTHPDAVVHLAAVASGEVARSDPGLAWEDHVVIDPSLFRPAEVDSLIADATKARRDLGWEPQCTFEEMIRGMVEADLERVS